MSFGERMSRVFLPFLLGYFFTSIFRTVNAMLFVSIGESLMISQGLYGFMTSLFFLGSALMQIPAGILVHRYGSRRVQSAMFFIAGIGSILFGCASGPILLIVSRFIIGFGMAGGIVTAYAANHTWFNQQEGILLNGMLYSLGTLGAVVSSWPIYALLQLMSWHSIVIWLGVLTMALATLILIVVPDPKKERKAERLTNHLADLKGIYTDRYFWKVAPLSVCVYGTFLSFQTYWVVPYLTHVNGLSEFTISIFLLIMALALIISPFIARLIKAFTSCGDWIAGIGALLAILFQMVIASNMLSASYLLWCGYAFFVGFTILLYANLNAHFRSLYGKKSAVALNVFLFFGVFILQFLYGVFASFWKICIPTCGLIGAFWIYIIIQSLSLIWYCFGRRNSYE